MRRDSKTIVNTVLVCLSLIIILGYTLYQARNLIIGPKITITSPQVGQTTPDQLVTISGIAKNITYISLNDRQIFVDENGNFKEELLLSPGYNLWTVQAKDKFGRVVYKRIEVVFSNT